MKMGNWLAGLLTSTDWQAVYASLAVAGYPGAAFGPLNTSSNGLTSPIFPSPSLRSLNRAVLLVPSVMLANVIPVLPVKKMPLGGFGSLALSPRATTKIGLDPA